MKYAYPHPDFMCSWYDSETYQGFGLEAKPGEAHMEHEEEHGNLKADVLDDKVSKFASAVWRDKHRPMADGEPDLKDCLCDVLGIITNYDCPPGLYKDVIEAVARHWQGGDV